MRTRCRWISQIPRWRPTRPRRGFTLFEIAVSLAIVAVAVVSVLVLFPSGLRQLTNDRFRAYSACLVNQLIDVYADADPSCVYTDHEGPAPWDVSIDGRVNAPDLELRCSNPRYGLLPVPTPIARRLDSDGEEIARLLDDGGQVYYVQPNVANAWREDLLPSLPPNDLQRLVIGVVGYAQDNAAFSFPLKRWPYYATVPSPPFHAIHNHDYGWSSTAPGTATTPSFLKAEDGGLPATWCANHATYCWQECVDPDPKLRDLFDAYWEYLWIGGVGQSLPTDYSVAPLGPQFKTRLAAYLDKAIAYAASTGLGDVQVKALMDTSPPAPYPYDAVAADVAARQILATSYLANALMCLTRWHQKSVSTAEAPMLDPPGVDLAATYAIAPALDLGAITHDRIVALMRNARWHYYRFTAQNPYAWAVPRPIEHASFIDYPLIEPDLFREPKRGAIWGAPSTVAAASWWKYAMPTPVTSVAGDRGAPLGENLTYPLSPLPQPSATAPDAAVSENGPAIGEVSHFTLCNRFAPSERCREIVVWAVDWQSYEDAETCASAPVDASRYPKAAPGGVKPVGADPRGWSSSLAPTADFADLMWGFTDGWGDVTGLEQEINFGGSGDALTLHRALIGSYVHVYRNPEKNLVFTSSVAALPTGADVAALKVHDTDRNVDMTNVAQRHTLDSPPDLGPPGANAPGCGEPPAVFAGAFGADRNGNDKLDRGPLPTTARLRAITIARYAYYDMRVSCQVH